ncbi:hypothetical protein CONCODRAFT_6241 [Conidiobolus coronatus NRRL 28638]|uniref:G-protein coupled receptors family 1 profile domain-containing protein n=1 Tax=Conidiobolus coronatus (strain ATCC 28846 / CBS 209.66 / NRRL 28638) TaxID=796925 RepID=A0A137P810_CONC2|nr:hypothetical protein CONCODRAFT_6241 [Conidiobolus coronatus NRRL 28638]|eukprot:KXN71138.1 hypothetical protein CONCODRAFT_6241 [Conidiobolus coronatus NRRL 28638]
MHITFKRFGISQVDMLVIFLLCVVDILFCTQNFIHLIWHWSSDTKINSNPVYCKVYFGLYWIIASFGYNLLVTLAIVRYFAICRKFIIPRSVAMLKPVFCSIISFAIGVCMAVYADPKENQGLTYCFLNIEANHISSPMELFLTIMTFFYLSLMSFSYYNISIYYYNTIQMMESNAKALNKIIQAEFNTNVRENYDDSGVEEKISNNNSNTKNINVKSESSNISTSSVKNVNSATANNHKVKCLTYRLISLIKVQSMIKSLTT